MSLALFKLESFTNAVPAPAAEIAYTRRDLDQAYAEGFAEARAQAEDAELRALGAGLGQLALALADEETRRASLRQEAVEALAPILTQVLDLMAPPLASRRLEEALRAELSRLASRGSALIARVTCSDRLRPMVERCLAEAGLNGIQIDPAPADHIIVTTQGGRIELVPDTIAGDLRALISEIKEDETTWTH
ncbi:hypothetical protein [Paracoccus sp. (in: a-proteobacteria)]|uniref:hypothetical protein n=1 Tax=Paracoccus sp. TaxID=267 RepID=UPI00396C40A2